jgi:8-oxo-dGTP diphosphatase
VIDVTAAILIENGRVLIARRKPGSPRSGLWEFPGGKVDPGEAPEECLKREIKEELGLDVVVAGFFGESVHAYADMTIRLIAYRVRIRAGELRLRDHSEITWAAAEELAGYRFAPADMPFVEMLQKGSAS